MTTLLAEETTVDTLPPGGSSISPDHLFVRPAAVAERGVATVSAIVPGRWQPRRRFDPTKLQELADSIKEHGVLTALKVFCNERGQFELIAGERRWRAAQLAGLTRVPVEVEELTARQIQEISIIDNLQRQDLQPDEEGEAFELAINELGISEAELARRLGVGRTYIQQRRALVDAAEEVREAFTEGRITFSQVRGILSGAGADKGIQAQSLAGVLRSVALGHRASEQDARSIANNCLMEIHRNTLLELGWGVVRRGEWYVFSQDKAPRIWSRAEILETVTVRRQPTHGPLTTQDRNPIEKEGTLDLLKKRGYHIDDGLLPWVGVGSERKFLSWSETQKLATQCADEIATLRKRYRAAGWELRQDGQFNIGCWNVYHGKTLMASSTRWDNAVVLIGRIEAGELQPPDPSDAGALSSTRDCAMPGCKNKCGHENHRTWKSGGKVRSGYVCNGCKVRLAEASKELKEQAGARFAETLAPFLGQGSGRDLTLLSLLCANHLGGTDKDLLAKIGELMGQANSKEEMSKAVAGLLFKQLWGDTYSAKPVMLTLLGLSDEIDLGTQEEQAS